MIFSDFEHPYFTSCKEKKRDITQSFDRKFKETNDNIKTPSKTSITQRLRTDLDGQLVYQQPAGVVKPVYIYPTFPLTATAVQSKGPDLKVCK